MAFPTIEATMRGAENYPNSASVRNPTDTDTPVAANVPLLSCMIRFRSI